MILRNFLKKNAFQALFSLALIVGFFSFASPTSAYASGNETVTGTFQALNQSVNFTADVPQNGGSFTGSFNGACTGSLTGNYDSSDNSITGNVNGSCSVLGISHSGTFNFQGTADLANSKLSISQVTRVDGSTPGSIRFVSLPITIDVQINSSNNNNTQLQGSPILDIPSLSVGQSYSLTSNTSIKFTSLPIGSNDVTFKTINLSSETAYQITSNMANGTFAYDLTLPLPAGAINYVVKYSPTTDLSHAQIVTQSITDNGDGTITIHGLNHFTVFVVDTNPSSVACVGAGSHCYTTIQGAVDAASSGDTINIQSGTYNQTVFVTKSLTLNGVDSGSGIPVVTKIVVWASGVSVNNINTSQVDGRPSTTFTNPVSNSNKTGASITGTGYANSNISWSISDSSLAHTVSGTGIVSAGGTISITGINLSALNDGNLTLSLTLNDGSSHTSSAFTSTSFKDTVAPASPSVSLTNPINNANKTSVSISGTGEAGASFKYTISDGTSSVTGSGTVSSSGSISVSGINVSSLIDGTVTLSVTQTDTVGNTSSAGTATATKDVIAPTVSAGSNKTTNAQFIQTGTVTDSTPSSGIASYSWTMVSGPGTITFGSANAVSTTISANTEGTYVIRLTATDSAGNSASSTFTLVWDTTAPTVNAGSDQIKNTTFTQTGTVTDSLSGVASTTWSMVSGTGTITFGSASSLSTTISASADGAYVIRLTSLDNAGNTSHDDFNLTWDTVAPVVNAGSNIVTNSVFSLSGTATDPSPSSGIASTTWSMVSGPGTVNFTIPTSLGTNASATVDGTYTVGLTVLDNAGNSTTSHLTLTWDTTPPTISAGADQVKNGIFTQAGSATDALSGVNTIQWSKVSGPGTITFGASTALTTNISASADGSYVIQLAVTDNAGNLSTDTMALTWDTAPPHVSTGSSVVSNSSFTRTATITDPSPSSGIASYLWTYTGPGTLTLSGTTTPAITVLNASVDGVYTLTLTAADNAGNSASADLSLTWDTTKPITTNNTDTLWHNSSVPVTLSCSDALSGCNQIIYTIDGSDPTTSGTRTVISGNTTAFTLSAEGIYTVQYYSTDNAGNQETTKSATVKIDLTRPVVSATGSSSSWYTTNISITLSASDALSGLSATTIRYAWDNTANATTGTVFTNGTVITIPSDGSHNLNLYVEDNAGNTQTFSGTYMLDSVNPGVSATGASTLWQTSLPSILITASDTLPGSGVARVTYQWDGGSSVSTSSGADITASFPSDGTHTLSLTVTDFAGRTGSFTGTYKIDRVAPATSNNVDGLWHNSSVTTTLTCTDATSGCATTYYTTDGSTPTTFSTSGNTIVLSTDGVYTIKYFSVDVAGNRGAVETAANQVRIDTSDPVVTSILLLNNTTGNNAYVKNRDVITITAVVTDNNQSLITTSMISANLSAFGLGSSVHPTSYNSSTGLATWSNLTASNSTEGFAQVTVRVTDIAGNPNSISSVTALIDNTAPVTADNAPSGWHNSSVTIALSCTDPTSTTASGCNTIYYTTDGSTPTINSSHGASIVLSVNGVYTIKYFAIDNAGNTEAVVTASNQVMIDKSAPLISGVTLSNTTTGNNSFVKDTDTLVLTATITDNNQTLLTTAMITTDLSALGGGSLVHPISYNSATGLATWASLIVSGSGNGVITITVNAADIANNPATAVNTAIISDNIAPTLSSVTLTSSNANPLFAKASDIVTLTFTSSEIISTPLVTIAGHSVTPNHVGNSWTAAYTLVSTDPQGAIAMTISSIADLAGNAGTAINTTSGITFDSIIPVAPTITITAPFINNASKTNAAVTITGEAGDTYTYTITDGTSSLTGSGTLTGGSITLNGVDVSTLHDGTLTLTVTTADSAGNNSLAATAATLKDTVLPLLPSVSITSINSNHSQAHPGDIVTLSLIASESIQTPTVILAGHTLTAINTSGNTWKVSYNDKDQDSLGLVSFSISFSDLAGNTAAAVTVTTDGSTMTFIPEPPSTAPGPVSPASAQSISCCDAKPGSAPSAVSAVSVGNGMVRLSWTKATGPVTRYALSFGIDPKKDIYGSSNIGDANTTSYIVNFLNPGVTYYFHIRAINGNMPGDYSTTIIAKAPGKTSLINQITSKIVPTVFAAPPPTHTATKGSNPNQPVTFVGRDNNNLETSITENPSQADNPVQSAKASVSQKVTPKQAALGAVVSMVIGTVIFYISRIHL